MADAILRYGIVDEVKVDAATALVAGQVQINGTRVGVYQGLNSAASGDKVSLAVTGTFEMTKGVTTAWVDDAVLYWNDTSNTITDVSAGATLAGRAVGAAVSADLLAYCRLIPLQPV